MGTIIFHLKIWPDSWLYKSKSHSMNALEWCGKTSCIKFTSKYKYLQNRIRDSSEIKPLNPLNLFFLHRNSWNKMRQGVLFIVLSAAIAVCWANNVYVYSPETGNAVLTHEESKVNSTEVAVIRKKSEQSQALRKYQSWYTYLSLIWYYLLTPLRFLFYFLLILVLSVFLPQDLFSW